jgi:hypothetical protein
LNIFIETYESTPPIPEEKKTIKKQLIGFRGEKSRIFLKRIFLKRDTSLSHIEIKSHWEIAKKGRS